MALEPSKHVNGRMWPPGVSGNPNGRPVGSRTVFSQGLLKDLASVWAERGRAAMEKTAIECQRSYRWRGDRRRSVVASGKMRARPGI
jgi:hypothetical protein